jgi:hypothetical protein
MYAHAPQQCVVWLNPILGHQSHRLQVVDLDVGGERFRTLRATLTRVPGSMLEACQGTVQHALRAMFGG